MQSVSFTIFLGGRQHKKITTKNKNNILKSSLDRHFHLCIIEFFLFSQLQSRILAMIHTKTVVDVSRGTNNFLVETGRWLVGNCGLRCYHVQYLLDEAVKNIFTHIKSKVAETAFFNEFTERGKMF